MVIYKQAQDAASKQVALTNAMVRKFTEKRVAPSITLLW